MDSDSNLALKIDRYLEQADAAAAFSGAALVARAGRIILHRGYGMADQENGVPNTSETLFQIASVGKPITATGAMILAQRGALDLHGPISRLLRGTPASWREITPHHLLTHTSGLTEYFESSPFAEVLDLDVDRVIGWLQTQPLYFEPGRDFKYSNSGYVLLGKLIEQVSGVSYGEFMRTNLFDPLEMRSTGRDFGNQPVALGYATPNRPARMYPITNRFGDGDLLSTVADLYAFDRGLYGDRILSDASRELMFTRLTNHHYGYGWEIRDDREHRMIGHSGDMPGFASELMRFPDDDTTIILLSNVESYAVEKAAWEIARLVLE